MERSRILRAGMKMITGSAGGVIITSCSVLFLSHFIPPSIYGVYQTIDAIALICGVGGTLALDKALFVSRSRSETEILAAAALVATLITATAAACIYLVISFTGLLYGVGTSILLAGYLLASSASRGLFVIARGHEIREERFGIVATSELVRGIGLAVGRVAAVVFAPNLAGLLLSGLFGAMVSAFYASRRVAPKIRRGLSVLGRKRFRAILHRQRNYALFESWGGFVRPLGQKGIILAVAPTFGTSAAAIASLALLLLLQPMQILVNAVVDIARSQLSKAYRGTGQGDYRAARLLPLVIAIVTPIILTIGVVLINLLSPYILGDGWSDVGRICMFMTPMIWAMMVARSLQSVLSQFKYQQWALVIDLGISLGTILLIFLFWSQDFVIEWAYMLSGLGMSFFIVVAFAVFFLAFSRKTGADRS